MISHLRGTVSYLSPETAVIDVGGVGYSLFPSSSCTAILSPGSEVEIWTYLAVREDALDLFGFSTKTELDFFKLLIAISGIGPKSALGILSVAPVTTLTSAIAAGDTSYLTQVSGIGKKSAHKIVLELQDRVGDFDTEEGVEHRREESDVLEALKALGYSTTQARDALGNIPSEVEGTSARIKEALKILGK